MGGCGTGLVARDDDAMPVLFALSLSFCGGFFFVRFVDRNVVASGNDFVLRALY